MGAPKVRKATQAGAFYPAQASDIKKMIAQFLGPELPKEEAIGCLMPHAGYIYSGKIAVRTASRVRIKDKVILIGPNHTGYGREFSLMSEGIWQTPLGEVNIDSGLSREILGGCPLLKEDETAHLYEHSLEVELPILQYFRNDFEIVPLIIGSNNKESLKQIGIDIAGVISNNNLKDKVLIIASSDMTHYEAHDKAEYKDKQAISAILDLDEDRLAEKVSDLEISMCGYAPAMIMLTAAKLLGALKAELIGYQTSADVSGDFKSVVGYAGIIIK
ncbi:MAG: AmmeMemoRadiSam system protein B [Candidatus Omnitrophota bacterium]|nr:AmmeMemoRadiSam system protein B [Candidatus Omnitrophota bacterium]